MKYFSICIFLSVVFAACESKKMNSEATAFGLVHAHSVGRVDVVVGNGVVQSIVFDEMELPYSWTIVSLVDTGTLKRPGFSYQIEGVDIEKEDIAFQGGIALAKKIRIGNEILEISATSPTRGVYSNANINGTYGIESWVRLDNNAKWYWEQMAAGNYDILKEDGTAYDIDWTYIDALKAHLNRGIIAAFNNDLKPDTVSYPHTKGDKWQKSQNSYGPRWIGLDADKKPGKGWADNMEAMANYLTGKNPNNLGIQKMGTTKAGNGKDTWEFDASTGATLIDISEYFNLATLAFNKAK